MRIKNIKDDERKDKADFSDENEDDVNTGCKSSTDEKSNHEVKIHDTINHEDNDNLSSVQQIPAGLPEKPLHLPSKTWSKKSSAE